jgi:predicted permease
MLVDLKNALRQLMRHPTVAVVALVTLSLGIGVNTAIFSVLNALIFRPSPYPESGRLVRIYRTTPATRSSLLSPANYLDIRATNTVFETMAAPIWNNANVAEPGQPADASYVLEVTDDFFPALGVSPALGRICREEEGQPGHPKVVVLSHGFWMRHFGGDPQVVGRTFRVDSEPVTVVGVMPASFDYPLLWRRIDLWRPLYMTPGYWRSRDGFWMEAIARLKPGVSLAQARAEMDVIGARLAHDYPEANAQSGLRLVSFDDSRLNDANRHVEWMIMGLAGFVLLIACTNLASVQLARAAASMREEAIRAALGASRWRLMGPRVVEGLLLSLGGGVGGLLTAFVIVQLVGSRIVMGELVGIDLPLDFRVIIFALAVSIATSLFLGVVPAWIISRVDINVVLAQAGRSATAGRFQRKVRHGLIVVELAIAIILLAGAGYCVRGFQRLTHREMGWRPEALTTGNLYLPRNKYPTDAARCTLYDQLVEGLKALPGAEHASVSWSAPILGFFNSNNVFIEGVPLPLPGQEPLVFYDAVTPDYFATVGIRLLQGRTFSSGDRADTRPVVVIGETMARQLWSGENPIGKRIKSTNSYVNREWAEVVGVVNDVQVASRFGPPESRFQAYRPIAQAPGYWVAVAVRCHERPGVSVEALRRAVAKVDADQALFLASHDGFLHGVRA